MIIKLYILILADKTFYTGITKDLQRRLSEHSAGQSKSTCKALPVKLIHSEEFPSYKEARKKEKYIKNFGAKRYLTKIKYQ